MAGDLVLYSIRLLRRLLRFGTDLINQVAPLYSTVVANCFMSPSRSMNEWTKEPDSV
jgi:hypothetical protein